MKKTTTIQYITILLIFLITSVNYAQKLPKIKGSKVVTLTEIVLDSVNSIELYKGIDLVLKKGDVDKLTVFADDNLHDVVDVDLNDGNLSLSLLKRISSKKKFELTLFISDLSLIVLNDDSTLINTDFYKATDLSIVLNNKSELNCFFDAKTISFEGNDSSESNSSFKAERIAYQLQDRAEAKGNSNANYTKIGLDARASAKLSGKSNEVIIEAKQSANAKLASLFSKVTDIKAEDKSSVYTNTSEDLVIEAKGSSKIYIYGKAEIDLIEFKDKAVLYKKE